MEQQQAPHVSIDGVSYPVAMFSTSVQQSVTVYNAFTADLTKAKLEVIKCEAALQNVGMQIGDAIKQELAELAKKQPAANEDTK